MLPKSKRLTTEDFKKMKGGKALHTPHLLLRVTRVAGGSARFAVIVSSSSYKRAVDRNLLRRRVYHALREAMKGLHECMVTVTCKKGALDATFAELEAEISGALLKNG